MTINANIDTKMDHSCNWRCCFGCKDAVDKDEPKFNQIVPEPQVAKKVVEAFKELRLVEEGKDTDPSALEYEFKAIHFKVKKTPETTPQTTPRLEKKNA